jgi:hypothetical protein
MSDQFKDHLLQEATALGLGENQIGANLDHGSNLGVGLREVSLDAATPLVFTPTVFIVMHTPSMYTNTGNNVVGETIKTLIETHAKSVSGIDVTYSLETSETPVGHDGQQLQVPTQSKRAAVNPSFTFTEVTGNLIWNLFVQWMKDIQDPDTNASMGRFDDENLQFLSSTYSMSVLAIQYDPSQLAKNIVDAAFISNMFPTDPGGSLGLERNIATSKTMDRTVTFSGHLQHNKRTREMGVEIATIMQDAKIRYSGERTPYLEEVNENLAKSGIQREVDSLVAE